ncbi:MAG: rod shape-determining protein RodA, partial [Bdellovibrionales bacterium]|nr:rod shape-determining protein RodA [Bdellovibrionales bacterium]
MELSVSYEEKSLFRRLDWNLILVILALNIIGLINLFSATHGPNAKDVEPLFINQIVWLVSSWSVFFMVTLIDYSIVNKICYGIYFINLMAIIYVDFFGKIALGAQRWIDFGFFRYQPSETMKLAIIMIMAKVLSQRNTLAKGMGFKELFWPIVLLLIPFALIVKQPDLGTAMMITAIGGTMVLFTKVKKHILISAVVIISISIPLAWKYVLHDYQKNRVLTFLSPENDPRKTGYNALQSKYAVGSGQFFGKGFRKGTQSQLEFLPERHTDFIFSVLSEEHGFVGALTTIGLFCVLFFLLIRIAYQSRDKFGALLAVG